MADSPKCPARVHETSDTQGAVDDYVLDGAVTDLREFRDGVGDGEEVYYCATQGEEFEMGVGTLNYGTGPGGEDELARDTVLESSNAGAAVNWGAGTRNVFAAVSHEHVLLLMGGADYNALEGALVIRVAGDSTIEIGRVDATSNTPSINFHSSGNDIAYDARIYATGGTGTAGEGTLHIEAEAIEPEGKVDLNADAAGRLVLPVGADKWAT